MTASRSASSLTDTQKRQFEYWDALNKELLRYGFLDKPRTARPRNWMDYKPFRRGGFTLSAAMDTRQNWIAVAFVTHSLPKNNYDRLLAARAAIEAEIGETLQWDRKPEKKRTLIGIQNHSYDPLDKASWPQQHAWLRDTLIRFHRAFAPRVAAL